MIVPDDALSKLMDVQSPIVTGLYILRHGEPASNIFKHEKNVRALGGNMKFDEMKKRWGQTLRVTGGAMGCLLVDATVIKDFCFEVGKPGAPDIPFMVHCAERGIETQARLDVMCGHIKGNNDVLWPDKDSGYRIERMN